MSVDLTFALAAPQQQGIDKVLQALEEGMHELGFAKGPDCVGVALDATRDVFDEVEDLDITEAGNGSSPRLVAVPGAATEYSDDDGVTIYALVAQHASGYLNAYMDVSARTFDRMVEESHLDRYLGCICTVALAMQSVGGFATFDQAFRPIPPHDIVECIRRTPGANASPALFGLIAFDSRTLDEVQNWAGTDYDVIPSTAGYWVLKHIDMRS